MCVCPLIPAASHIGITKERYQRIVRNTGIVLNFADFPKNALFKSYGVICLPRAAPAQTCQPSRDCPGNCPSVPASRKLTELPKIKIAFSLKPLR